MPYRSAKLCRLFCKLSANNRVQYTLFVYVFEAKFTNLEILQVPDILFVTSPFAFPSSFIHSACKSLQSFLLFLFFFCFSLYPHSLLSLFFSLSYLHLVFTIVERKRNPLSLLAYPLCYLWISRPAFPASTPS